MIDLNFLTISALLTGFVAVCALTGRPRLGLWYGWLTALFLLPSWMETRLAGSLMLDFRAEAGAAALLGLALSSGGVLRFRPMAADVLMLMLTVSMTYTEFRCGVGGLTTVPTIVVRWVLPYLVGRNFFASAADVPRIGRFLAAAAGVLAVYGLVEMATNLNPSLTLTGQKFAFLDQEQGFRMGLRRAQGLASHPIFFGLTMVMLLPWAFESARRARAEGSASRHMLLPALAVAGVMSSLSRGPVVAALGAAAVLLFFRVPRYRPGLIVALVAGLVLAISGYETIVEEAASLIGESDETSTPIVMKGEIVKYTGTRHRVLQFKAYEDAIADARLFGFGSQLLAVRAHYPVHSLFWSIDCHYLLFHLQYGICGLILFTMLAAVTLYRLGRIAWDPSGPLAGLAGGLFAAIAAVDVILASVYLAYDFGAVWFFYAGLAGNLSSLHADAAAGRARDPAVVHAPYEEYSTC